MATIISGDSAERHSVNKYTFKVLPVGSSTNEAPTSSQSSNEQSTQKFTKENNPKARESDVDSSALTQSSKDSLIESLMKKTDEMSSNFIKLQMKLEEQEEEYKEEIKRVQEEAYNEGVEVGKLQAQEDTKSNLSNGIAQFSSSVVKLEASAKEFEKALEGIKHELITAALDISKEVIGKELSKYSSEIAKVLADELIVELQSASNVTLRVNPKDHGAISEHAGTLEHVKIISDSAVSEGGVVAISDAGNIDSQISKRFERVRKAALSE